MDIKNLVSIAMSEPPTTIPPLSASTVSILDGFPWEYETLGDASLLRAFLAAGRFAGDMLELSAPRWLSLLGPAGTGKTHLAAKIMKLFRVCLEGGVAPRQDRRKSAWTMRGRFISWSQASSAIRDGDHRLVEDFCHDWFLCIDDIFAEHQSDFLTAKLCEILDRRLGKWTVITSNKTLQQISEVEVRIASRLKRQGSQIIEMNGVPDFSFRRKS